MYPGQAQRIPHQLPYAAAANEIAYPVVRGARPYVVVPDQKPAISSVVVHEMAYRARELALRNFADAENLFFLRAALE